MSERILITGGAGFIGINLASRELDAGKTEAAEATSSIEVPAYSRVKNSSVAASRIASRFRALRSDSREFTKKILGTWPMIILVLDGLVL